MAAPVLERHRGRIKWYDIVKGYGFVERDDEPDLFFHITEMVDGRPPRDGEPCSFAIKIGKAGRPAAISVKLGDK
jgi:CspA family cold shock protein